MYLLVFPDNVPTVIASAKGVPREFTKAKKAKNFVQGRPRLRDLRYRLVDDITGITNRLKVDF